MPRIFGTVGGDLPPQPCYFGSALAYPKPLEVSGATISHLDPLKKRSSTVNVGPQTADVVDLSRWKATSEQHRRDEAIADALQALFPSPSLPPSPLQPHEARGLLEHWGYFPHAGQQPGDF